MHDSKQPFKEKILARLEDLRPIFSNAAVGDFSKDVPLYEDEDELTETYVGVQIMLEVIREQIASLVELNEKLEGKISELKQEIALREEMMHRKDEFISILGHELRNPLAPITYAAALLRMMIGRRELKDPEVEQSVAIIERQSAQMSRLIDDLLDASRILHGKLEMRRSAMALAPIVESAAEAVRAYIKERGHRLSVVIPHEAIIVNADALRIEQILINLLNNAAQYTVDKGEITISLGAEGDLAYIRVRDTGIGIEPDFLPRIFDIFAQQRVPHSSKGGLGIGLMIAKGIAGLHGGNVSAESPGRGRGSVFTLTLPLDSKNISFVKVPSVPPLHAASPPRRILVVDDNTDLAETIGKTLKEYGNDIRVAFDGASAIEIAEEFRPEVVFLDIAMPEMDGFAIAEKMRASEGAKAARIIALTGFGQESDFDKSKSAGFYAHLVKPPAVYDLLAVLQ